MITAFLRADAVADSEYYVLILFVFANKQTRTITASKYISFEGRQKQRSYLEPNGKKI